MMGQQEAIKQISRSSQSLLIKQAEIDGMKKLFEAAILKGDKEKAEKIRFKIHATMDLLLDHQASISTFMVIAMNPK